MYVVRSFLMAPVKELIQHHMQALKARFLQLRRVCGFRNAQASTVDGMGTKRVCCLLEDRTWNPANPDDLDDRLQGLSAFPTPPNEKP